MLLIPPLKKKKILHSPLQQDLLSLLLQKAKHHPLLLCSSNQASVTDYLMVPALVKTPILPPVSTTACHMALVYTLLLEASSTWSTRLHNLAQHPSVQSSSTSFLLLTLFRMLTASASLRLCTCHSPWLECSISIVPALFLHFLQVPAYPITSHRILSDGPIYTAVLPSTLSSLCPESPKNRAGLFPH